MGLATESSSYVETMGKQARKAAYALAGMDDASKSNILRQIAAKIREHKQQLIDANAKDIAAAESAKLDRPVIERLRLNEKRIESMALGVEQIAGQTDPVGQTIEGYVLPNRLRIEKRRCPIGVILFFYESRPNVTSDAAALCIKSGNAIILRGGKEAFHSNQAIVKIIRDALSSIPSPGTPASGEQSRTGESRDGGNSAFSVQNSAFTDAVQFVDSTDRALVPQLLKLDRFIDLVIPRGGESLIRAVVADSTIPVLKHFTGNCHIYIDPSAAGMEKQVRKICVNAKTSYPGGAVCNAVEHLLFHKDIAANLLPKVCEDLAKAGVEIRGDDATRKLFPNAKPASEQDWSMEYLAFIVGIKVVDSLAEAIEHINSYGSHHTDGILAANTRAIDQFIQGVDSASIMVNASTRFADGGEYGLGAEIGISTDKLHARGPMGASDLTTYKWIVTGDGHCRGAK